MAELLLDPDADDQRLLAQVLTFYHRALLDSPAILDGLHRRGVSRHAVEHFRLGYANRTLGLKLPDKRLKAGSLIRGRLAKLGLYRGTGREHFNGSVTVAVHAADGTGQVVDVYGRKTHGVRLRRGTPLEVYLGNGRKGVWNVEALAGTEEVVLCSSAFDALASWSLGYRNVTCAFGPDALTDDHLAALAEFRVRRVVLTHETVASRLLDAGIDCFLLQIPAGVGIHAHVSQSADPADFLGSLIRKAAWLGNGKALERTPAAPANDAVAEPPTESVTADTTAVAPTRSATPLPPLPVEVAAEVGDDEVRLAFGDRHYRVMGWLKNPSFDQLRVTVRVANDHGLFIDVIDLYAAKQRRSFVAQAAVELHVEEAVVAKDLGRVLLKLEELQDRRLTEAAAPKDTTPTMTEQERTDALALLRDPDLLDRIVADFAVVGEATNKLVGYLAAVSRKLDEPLAVVIQSSSAAGKTSLMDAVLAFVPAEDLVKFSAVTGQSLYYLGAGDLRHKVLAVVEEEGATRASYALKLLQSEGELTIASTGKEGSTGRLVTQTYRVQGPVTLFLTTASAQVDEELLNRCLMLTVDEGRHQTRAIHHAQRQRQTLEGQLACRSREATLALHRNAQRLLRPLLVVNPYAGQLTFADAQTRTRRDHAKYLTLIRTITLLHQHQRTVNAVEHDGRRVEYVEVTPADIAVANRLAHEVLGRSLDDLPPQTRRLLTLIDAMVAEACERQGIDRADYHFSRRDVRAYTSWGHSQLAVHLRRLEELEYLIVHRGHRGRSLVYELVAAPADAQGRYLPGLLDVVQLRRICPGSEAPNPGQREAIPECFRGTSGPLPGHFRPSLNGASVRHANHL